MTAKRIKFAVMASVLTVRDVSVYPVRLLRIALTKRLAATMFAWMDQVASENSVGLIETVVSLKVVVVENVKMVMGALDCRVHQTLIAEISKIAAEALAVIVPVLTSMFGSFLVQFLVHFWSFLLSHCVCISSTDVEDQITEELWKDRLYWVNKATPHRNMYSIHHTTLEQQNQVNHLHLTVVHRREVQGVLKTCTLMVLYQIHRSLCINLYTSFCFYWNMIGDD